tara:strand:- start:8134 stop:8982 length:849 start_codon:yes stop_codon:yes gene_type:complete
MDTSREDVGIAIRSAFLNRGTQQRFSLFALIILSIFFLVIENIDAKPLNYVRSIIKDGIYRGSSIVSSPARFFESAYDSTLSHFFLYKNYEKLEKENKELKSVIDRSDFLILENTQLRKLIEEEAQFEGSLVSARVILDKESPYLNSFIINSGGNKNIKNGMTVLDGQNFIGRIVDVNFFSSRVLLITDLNSKIPVVIEPEGYNAILSGRSKKKPTLDFLPENHQVKEGDKVYTSGKEGIFLPGIPIGEVSNIDEKIKVNLFSDLDQITFVNINLSDFKINN